MLVRLLYASRAAAPLTQPVVDSILDQSRRRNPSLGVTGVLCFSDEVFIQILEGGREEVCELYNAIVRDARHAKVRLLVYEEIVLDMRRPNRYRRYTIPEEGLVLSPNQLYLGRTVELTETRNLVPMLEGRSSVGRLGLFVHITAGFGDVGFRGYWTLEMFAVQPIRVYPGVPIAQIFYHTVEGAVTDYRGGKYQNNSDIQPSLLFKDFEQVRDPQMRLPFGQEVSR